MRLTMLRQDSVLNPLVRRSLSAKKKNQNRIPVLMALTSYTVINKEQRWWGESCPAHVCR